MSAMILLLIVIGIYLAVGIVALLIFDIATGRIRNRISPASDETRTTLANTGYWTGHKGAIVITVLATWIFYPVVIYGFVEDKFKRRGNANKIQR